MQCVLQAHYTSREQSHPFTIGREDRFIQIQDTACAQHFGPRSIPEDGELIAARDASSSDVILRIFNRYLTSTTSTIQA